MSATKHSKRKRSREVLQDLEDELRRTRAELELNSAARARASNSCAMSSGCSSASSIKAPRLGRRSRS